MQPKLFVTQSRPLSDWGPSSGSFALHRLARSHGEDVPLLHMEKIYTLRHVLASVDFVSLYGGYSWVLHEARLIICVLEPQQGPSALGGSWGMDVGTGDVRRHFHIRWACSGPQDCRCDFLDYQLGRPGLVLRGRDARRLVLR